ncbi:DUF427 domain-containing protein [Umezawaea tangerina]|uniref:Uncharacterized protein (DUF427 family) n=1 Tax=Umezawaea tangerina TaxID=84725 RepID=A0A2T0SK65_9PSEU|nr:DUF427 domain-containing protein [Umezawaea tangerina]PRY33801.1 uncharacterized protein (DUF427 family) [Umezawaea tangerina]
MAREVKIPGPDHPITVTPTADRVVVRAGDRVIADTTKALTLQESTYPAVQYIPVGDIDQSVLRRTDTSTYCPFKGDASYYTITGGEDLTDVVWFYEEPYPAVAEIAGHVAFYPNKVDITVG